MKKTYVKRMVLIGILAGGLMFGSQGWADDTTQLKEQVQALQNRVDQLESQLSNNSQTTMPTAMPVYDQWNDPFAQMMLMQQQMDRNMHQAFADTGMFTPKIDMKQTDKNYLVTMDIPGMDKNKINVETKDGMLIISGERKSEIENNKNNQYYRQEISFGTFMQEIPLPDDARADRINAKYNNGVLTVTVAREKKEEKNAGGEKITVQ